MSEPHINVTPLIDVLLVLLIIFMVVTPLKPSAFEARVPQESKQRPEKPHPHTLIVGIGTDTALTLNGIDTGATVANPNALIRVLSDTFEARLREQVVVEASEGKRVEKTVFIKAPRELTYGNVAKVVDSVKIAGAHPVGLHIDGLE